MDFANTRILVGASVIGRDHARRSRRSTTRCDTTRRDIGWWTADGFCLEVVDAGTYSLEVELSLTNAGSELRVNDDGNGIDGPLYLDDIPLENTDACNLDNPLATPIGVLASPVATTLQVVRPNPFNPRATIPFEVPAAGPVRLQIGGRVALGRMSLVR